MQADERRACAIIIGLSGAFYGFGIGAGSHFNSDDVLYAQMAREMVQSGDLLDNRFLGVAHFEKPPLLLWSLAAAGSVFGWGEAALRAPVTLWSIAGLVAFYLLARALGLVLRAAATATALLAVSTLYLLMTRRLMTDIPLLCCALWSVALSLRGRPVASGSFAGLAVMAKGVAAAPLLVAGYGFALLSGRCRLHELLRALLVSLAVAAPWHIAASLRHGTAFWSGYLGHHVSTRMTAAVVPGLSSIELLEVLARERVLLVLAALGLAAALARRLSQPADKLALTWLLLCAAPLLASTTVLPHYLLPLTPALALFAVGALPARVWEHRLVPLLGGVVVLTALVADPAKLVWWLDPDFNPDEKAMGQRLAQTADADDVLVAYDLTHASLVFYSGGLPIAIYADDARFLDIQSAVLMNQRQAGHPGAVFDLRMTPLPAAPPGARRFVVARAGEPSLRAERLLRATARGQALFRLDAGGLSLLNDAGQGVLLPAAP